MNFTKPRDIFIFHIHIKLFVLCSLNLKVGNVDMYLIDKSKDTVDYFFICYMMIWKCNDVFY